MEMGDYTGAESCIDLRQSDEAADGGRAMEHGGRRPSRRLGAAKRDKEYPPPITLLDCADHVPLNVPWALQRYYTSDGRLVMREERIANREYFLADRSNGRLTLRLVAVDDCFPAGNIDGDEKREEFEAESDNVHETDHGAGEEEVMAEPPQEMVAIGNACGGGGGGRKWCIYDVAIRSNPCMLELTVPAIRSVQI
ncbi:hypothetical protein NMG60_11031462 [Bertholletia excelsa]